MKSPSFLLLVFVYSSTLFAQQVDDIYENLETRSRFKILQVFNYSDLRKQNADFSKTRPSRLAATKSKLIAKYRDDIGQTKKDIQQDRSDEIEREQKDLQDSEKYLDDMLQSSGDTSLMRDVIQDARTRINRCKYRISKIDSILARDPINDDLKKTERKLRKVDDEANALTNADDLRIASFDSQLRNDEIYVILSTDDLIGASIASKYVPFSIIRNSRIYKKIN